MKDHQPKMNYDVVIRKQDGKVEIARIVEAINSGDAKQQVCEYFFGYKEWKENRAELKARNLTINAQRLYRPI